MATSSSTRRMIGGIEETSASFEARTAPRSYPTDGDLLHTMLRQPPVGRRCAGGAPTSSDIEGSTDRYRVGLGFETEISCCALDFHMAQERSNRLQIASAFQNVESLRSP
jgi:hypothetical protein